MIEVRASFPDAAFQRVAHRDGRARQHLESRRAQVPATRATKTVHRSAGSGNRQMCGATRFVERGAGACGARSDRPVTPPGCRSETKESLTVVYRRCGNGSALGGGNDRHEQAINAGLSGFGITVGGAARPRLPENGETAAQGVAARAHSSRYRCSRADPTKVQDLPGMLVGAAVGHSATPPITNVAAGISVTTSNLWAVATEGLQIPRRMRDTCTRLMPTLGASVPSCSAGLRSIHDCRAVEAVISTMYAERTARVKTYVRQGQWKD